MLDLKTVNKTRVSSLSIDVMSNPLLGWTEAPRVRVMGDILSSHGRYAQREGQNMRQVRRKITEHYAV